MIKYGLISDTDARTLEKTLDLVIKKFKTYVHITEIGLYNCETSKGIYKYLDDKGVIFEYTGIDNEKDKPVDTPYWMESIVGDSNEVYHQLDDESQHLIFIDGCHCFAHVVSDFFCYAPKVKKGGFIAFHDTGKHIKPFKDFQHGDKENPDAYISVRKALLAIGMFLPVSNFGFNLIFDEADETNEAGGICVFKKLY